MDYHNTSGIPVLQDFMSEFHDLLMLCVLNLTFQWMWRVMCWETCFEIFSYSIESKLFVV